MVEVVVEAKAAALHWSSCFSNWPRLMVVVTSNSNVFFFTLDRTRKPTWKNQIILFRGRLSNHAKRLHAFITILRPLDIVMRSYSRIFSDQCTLWEDYRKSSDQCCVSGFLETLSVWYNDDKWCKCYQFFCNLVPMKAHLMPLWYLKKYC